MSDGQNLPREGNVILGRRLDLEEKCPQGQDEQTLFSPFIHSSKSWHRSFCCFPPEFLMPFPPEHMPPA